MKHTICFLFIFFVPAIALTKLNVLTTTTTLKSIVEAVGGDYVEVDSITRGPQDPHFVEAKPSYMIKTRRADLVISVGLDLEIGWLSNIIRGARNPNVMKGSSGYLEAGTLIEPIEIPKGKIDRSQGDVHSLGNPHFTLDPIRVVKVAEGISKRLSELDTENKLHFKKNMEIFTNKLNQNFLDWNRRIKVTGVKQVITYHKTLNYFLHRFGLELSGSIEPKAGIPPTARHILSLIETIKKKKVSCVLVESFFETSAAERIKKSVSVQIEVVPTEVRATKEAVDYEALIEALVASIEKCSVARRTKNKL